MKFNKALLSVTAAAGLLAVGTIAANADQVTVQPGDTVSKIAQEHNTTVDSIQQLNNLANVNLIYAGQTLEVGENGQATASDNATTTSATTNNYQLPAQTYNYNYQAATTPTITITIITIATTLMLILKLLLTLVTTTKLQVAQVKKLLKHGSLIRNLVVVIQLLMVNTLVSINYLHHI